MRLGLTAVREELEEVLIDFDCDGNYEDTCDDDELIDLCNAEPDEPICQLCAEEDEEEDESDDEDEETE